jgi:Mg2+ and Co2+ transporter CorA
MWVHSIKAKEMRTIDLHSLEELQVLEKDSDWFWIDCMEPSSEEFKIISELLFNEAKILDDLKKGKTFLRYKKCNDCTVLSISVVAIRNELKIYPIYIAVKENMLLTLRSRDSSKPIENAIQTLQDCVGEVEETSPSFVLCEALSEMTNENLEVVMLLREKIENIEREAMTKPSKKTTIQHVFELKKEIAMLYRLLWSEERMMSSLKDGLIPNVKLCQETILTLEDAIDDISRELQFLNSYDSALDVVLTIQDLGMIHGVERKLIYLTIVMVVVNLILILELLVRALLS